MSIIFLHIPKTGGTSLRLALEKDLGPNRLLKLYRDQPGMGLDDVLAQPLQNRVIYGHNTFGIHKHLGIQPVYATMLRDPVDRVVSLFRHYAREPSLPYHAAIREGLRLEDMLDARMTPEVCNHMTFIISGSPGAKQGRKEALRLAKSNLRRHFAFACTLDMLPRELPYLGEYFATPTLSIGRENIATGPALDIDAKLRRKIIENNRLDLDLFQFVRRRANFRRVVRQIFSFGRSYRSGSPELQN